MRTLLDAGDRRELESRAARLRPDTPARWGRFTAPRMLAHVTQALGMASGEVPVAPKRVPWLVRHAPVKHLMIYVLPFPKGLPTVPELLARPSLDPASASDAEWADELRAFGRGLERVGALAAKGGPWPSHPAFGPLSGREWGALQYRHLDHHFRQFGI